MLEDVAALDEEWAHWPVAPLRSFSPGLQPRMRALLVIPIVMAILITIFVVMSFCIKKRVKEPEDKQGPVETTDYYPGHNTAAPVQETLHGCQPVAQEDGKESRISVQERQLTGSVDLKHLV
ncbi:hypothetical protein ACRRTK_013232 [Alexandromys fortis]